jgi:hypothetical protein
MKAVVNYMQSNSWHESVHACGASGYDGLSRAVLVECVAATDLRCSGIMPINKQWKCEKKYVTRINRRSLLYCVCLCVWKCGWNISWAFLVSNEIQMIPEVEIEGREFRWPRCSFDRTINLLWNCMLRDLSNISQNLTMSLQILKFCFWIFEIINFCWRFFLTEECPYFWRRSAPTFDGVPLPLTGECPYFWRGSAPTFGGGVPYFSRRSAPTFEGGVPLLLTEECPYF